MRRIWSPSSTCRTGAACTSAPRCAGGARRPPASASNSRPSFPIPGTRSIDPFEDVEGDVAADHRALVLLQAERNRLERHAGLRTDDDGAARDFRVAILQCFHPRPLPALREQIAGERLGLARIAAPRHRRIFDGPLQPRVEARPADLDLLDLRALRRTGAGGVADPG